MTRASGEGSADRGRGYPTALVYRVQRDATAYWGLLERGEDAI